MKKYKGIITIIFIVLLLFGLSKLPVKEYLNALTGWFEGFGVWAPVLFFLFFALTQSWLFPVFLLSVCAGILFGAYKGFLVVSLGNLISCVLMFMIARYVGRDWFKEKIQKYKKVGGFIRAVESEGWKMLAMLRAVPIVHMIVLNITCGLSKVRLKDYLLGTWLGMAPMLFAYAYMGSLTDSVLNSSTAWSFSGSQNVIYITIGIVVFVVFGIYIKQVLKKYTVPVPATVQGNY